MAESKIIEAVGMAAAASPHRQRGAYARELDKTVADAVLLARQEGVTDPDMVLARMNSARAAVREKYKKLDAQALAARTVRETAIRQKCRAELGPSAEDWQVETLARARMAIETA